MRKIALTFILLTLMAGNAFALTVQYSSVDPGQGVSAYIAPFGSNTYLAGVYNLYVSDWATTISGFCVDPAYAPTTPANNYGLQSIVAGSVYSQAAYLYDQYLFGGITQDKEHAAAIQVAIWEIIFDEKNLKNLAGGNFYLNGANGNILGLAQGYVNMASNVNNFNASSYMLLVSPADGPPKSFGTGSQDYLVRVPEPGTMLLLGSGLIALALFGRRRKK
jgi:hypothetical protein